MSHKNNLFKEILIRKIPQIVGMYIASVWLAVEMSDWMSSRFDLPTLFSSYVFVGMAAFLPAVIIVAWGHGRKGKDEWSLHEKIFIPINFLAALFAVSVLVKPIESSQTQPATFPSSQMEVRSIIDTETGSKMEFEVPKESFHQKVVSYFWDNQTHDKSLSWLSYGASWLLAQDMKRTPFISVTTPYDSESLLSQILEKGFKKAMKVPLSLALKIARSRSAKWVVLGAFANEDKLINFTAKLYNVETGQEVKELSASNKNPLTALDTISDEISQVILSTAKVADDMNIIPQLAIAEHTSNDLRAIEKLIQAKNTVVFENDYKKAIGFLKQSITIDPTFANAQVLFMQYFGVSGDIPSAIEHAKKALELDYKLYQESVFLVKANLFAYQAQSEKSLKVLENWVKIYPESVEALWILGSNYIQKGSFQDEALAVYKKIIELEGPKSHAFVNLAKIYRLQNNQTLAIDALEKYLAQNPTKSSAYIELADTYRQFGEFDKALEMYEESSLYDNKDFKAEIGIATISIAKGKVDDAFKQLQEILKESKTDSQKLIVLGQISQLYLKTGQVHKSLALIDEISRYGKKVWPPLSSLFQADGTRVLQLSIIGQFSEAEKAIAELNKKLKPPYDVLTGAFSKYIYEKQKDIEKYKKSLAREQQFFDQFKLSFLKPSILQSKGLLKFWAKDYSGALELFNQGIQESKQSFIVLMSTEQLDELILAQARTLMAMERYDEALTNLDNLLKRKPMQAKAHVLKAKIYHATENSDNLSNEISIIDEIWKNADDDYLDYQEYLLFKKTV